MLSDVTNVILWQRTGGSNKCSNSNHYSCASDRWRYRSPPQSVVRPAVDINLLVQFVTKKLAICSFSATNFAAHAIGLTFLQLIRVFCDDHWDGRCKFFCLRMNVLPLRPNLHLQNFGFCAKNVLAENCAQYKSLCVSSSSPEMPFLPSEKRWIDKKLEGIFHSKKPFSSKKRGAV